ncbi:MAG: exosortase H-associated membrane protein [Halioglobus sp.]
MPEQNQTAQKQLHKQQLRQFLLFVFVLIIPCFGLWTVASEILARPAVGFVNFTLTHWFSDVVQSLYIDGQKAILLTPFGEAGGQLVPASQTKYQIGYPINTRLVSYSIPFYAALHFAMPQKDYLNRFIWGLVVLYPLMALGLLALCMKELMVGLGSTFLEQPNAWVPNANLIGLTYQMSVLLVPTLGPVLLWLCQNRNAPMLAAMSNQQEKEGR